MWGHVKRNGAERNDQRNGERPKALCKVPMKRVWPYLYLGGISGLWLRFSLFVARTPLEVQTIRRNSRIAVASPRCG